MSLLGYPGLELIPCKMSYDDASYLDFILPEESFVVLALRKALDRRHEDIIIAEKIGEDELRECVAKAGVLRGVENDELDCDVEPLPNGGGEAQEAVLQAVLDDVFFVGGPASLRAACARPNWRARVIDVVVWFALLACGLALGLHLVGSGLAFGLRPLLGPSGPWSAFGLLLVCASGWGRLGLSP